MNEEEIPWFVGSFHLATLVIFCMKVSGVKFITWFHVFVPWMILFTILLVIGVLLTNNMFKDSDK